MKTLEDLFLDELAVMYDAENRLTKALPKMVRRASHEELWEAFESHLNETEEHVTRLEEVFRSFDRKPKGKKCEAIVGLLKEADEIASDHKGCITINAALISAAQKVEHYEIASYGCLVEWAKQLDNDVAAELLQETLDEEKAADDSMTELARERCNASAQAGARNKHGRMERRVFIWDSASGCFWGEPSEHTKWPNVVLAKNSHPAWSMNQAVEPEAGRTVKGR